MNRLVNMIVILNSSSIFAVISSPNTLHYLYLFSYIVFSLVIDIFWMLKRLSLLRSFLMRSLWLLQFVQACIPFPFPPLHTHIFPFPSSSFPSQVLSPHLRHNSFAECSGRWKLLQAPSSEQCSRLSPLPMLSRLFRPPESAAHLKVENIAASPLFVWPLAARSKRERGKGRDRGGTKPPFFPSYRLSCVLPCVRGEGFGEGSTHTFRKEGKEVGQVGRNRESISNDHAVKWPRKR